MQQALSALNSFAVKLAVESQTTFAVEAVAASQVRELAQRVGHWKGRVFLPLLQGVGTGKAIEKTLDKASQNLAVLVMQLADGSVQAKRFEGDALVMVAWALASTLALLNAAGFIHGDLKPANVLWQANSDAQANLAGRVPGPNGWPLLTDFGSAQAFGTMHPEQQPLSLDDQIQTHGWTKEYAAPEVVSCGGKWKSIRSDMFSWALTIHAVSQHQALPAGLHQLCQKCLDANPKKRPRSFAEIAATLEKVCPSCILWGLALWDQQQAYFDSSGHAMRHVESVCKQGLEVLLSQRRHFSEDRIAESDALELLAREHLRMHNSANAVELYKEAVTVDPWKAVAPNILNNLGNVYGTLGDVPKKRDLLEKALKMYEAHFGEKDHPRLASTLASLGNAYGALGDVPKKRDLLEKALKIKEAYFGEKDHPDLASTLHNLGDAYGALGDVPKKRDLLEKALKMKEAYFGEKNHPHLAITLHNLGDAYGALGDVPKKRDLLEKALKMYEAYFGDKDHPDMASTLHNLGNAYGALGDVPRKRDLLEKALKTYEAYLGEKDHPDLALTLHNLGNVYGTLGDVPKKRDLLEKALKMYEAHFGEKDHPRLANTLASLGKAYGALGDVPRERDLLEKALKIQEAYFGEKDHPDLALTLHNLGNVYGTLGDVPKKRDLLEKALKMYEAHFGEKDHPRLANTLASLGKAYGALGDVSKQRDLLEKASKIMESYFAGKYHPHLASI